MWQLLLLTLTLTLTLARTPSDQVCRAWQRLPCPETHEAIEWLRARPACQACARRGQRGARRVPPRGAAAACDHRSRAVLVRAAPRAPRQCTRARSGRGRARLGRKARAHRGHGLRPCAPARRRARRAERGAGGGPNPNPDPSPNQVVASTRMPSKRCATEKLCRRGAWLGVRVRVGASGRRAALALLAAG